MYYSRAVNGYFFTIFFFLHTYYTITYTYIYECVPLRSEDNIILYFYIQVRVYDCVYNIIMHIVLVCVCVCTVGNNIADETIAHN